jgi:hypothetical protein
MLASATLSVSGTTVLDLFPAMATSVAADWTPAHRVKLQNNGSGTVRVAELGAVQASLGIKVGPGEVFEMDIAAGDRLGLLGNGGIAAGNIDVMLWTV